MGERMQKILTHEMTRKEFLTYLGVFCLTVLGISAFLKRLADLNPTQKTKLPKQVKANIAFGSGQYGV